MKRFSEIAGTYGRTGRTRRTDRLDRQSEQDGLCFFGAKHGKGLVGALFAIIKGWLRDYLRGQQAIPLVQLPLMSEIRMAPRT